MRRIAIVVGESSGDLLGAALVTQLQRLFPKAEFAGIAGPQMEALGVKSLYPMETLSVMGLAAVLKRLPAILKIRRGIIQYFIDHPPDIFIGIDAPDFNLTVEERLHQQGIKTVHYVSPSIWAWKSWRIKKIMRATDLVLCLLPFEVELYQRYQHPACFVGHPLADQIPMTLDRVEARQALQLKEQAPCVALLPGSRGSELRYLLSPFLQAMVRCKQVLPELQIVLPLAHPKLEVYLTAYQPLLAQLQVKVLQGQSRLAMMAADVVLLASGTATLEAMLLKKPMVVAYKFGAFSAWIARLMVKIKWFSLPNIIANDMLVPEFFQDQVTMENLANAVLDRLQYPDAHQATVKRFHQLHQQLRCGASQRAAEAIASLL